MDNAGNPYEAVLADLRAKRDEIDKMIAGIEKFSSGQVGMSNAAYPSQGSAVTSVEIRSDSFFGMSVTDGVKKFLEMKKKPLKANEIADALIEGGMLFTTATPANSVASVLSRYTATENSEIVKVGRGLFGLAKWYPNSGRFKQAKAKKSNESQLDSSETNQDESYPDESV